MRTPARHSSPGRRYDAGFPRSGNWVRLEAGTFTLARPEYLREAEEVDTGGGGGRGRGRRRENVSPEETGGLRERRRENGPGEGPFTVSEVADGTMGGVDEPEAPPAKVTVSRNPKSMSDAELRLLLSNAHLREKLRRPVTEEASVEVAGESVLPTERERATIGPAPPVASEAAAGGSRSERGGRGDGHCSRCRGTDGSVGRGGGWHRGAVPERELADYEEEGPREV